MKYYLMYNIPYEGATVEEYELDKLDDLLKEYKELEEQSLIYGLRIIKGEQIK